MVNRTVLEGKGRFINLKRRTANKMYDNFFIYVPVEVARDSSFPFKPGEALTIRVEKGKNEVVLKKSK